MITVNTFFTVGGISVMISYCLRRIIERTVPYSLLLHAFKWSNYWVPKIDMPKLGIIMTYQTFVRTIIAHKDSILKLDVLFLFCVKHAYILCDNNSLAIVVCLNVSIDLLSCITFCQYLTYQCYKSCSWVAEHL